MMEHVVEQFSGLLHERGIELTDRQLEQFELYYRELVAWNEKMNLTAITDREQVYMKHFYDSVTPSFFLPFKRDASIVDVGSGAGFPGIPLKIVFPHLRLTIVDSLNKRIRFLEHVVDLLELKHVSCVHARAEDAGRKPELRDKFDYAAARAVARLNVLVELCLPFVATGGLFMAMKGMAAADERVEAGFSLAQLNGKLEQTYSFELPRQLGERHIITVRKTGATPRLYPRKAGLPGKQPLVRQ